MQPDRNRPQAYPIRGILSDVRQVNRSALEGTLVFTTRGGETHRVTACAYGRAVVAVGRQFRDGPTHLFGHFDKDRFIAYCEARKPRPPVTAMAATTDAATRTPPSADGRDALAPQDQEARANRPAPTEPQAVGRHWKMQAYGPGRTLRKQIEVRAYRRYERKDA